MKDFSNITLIGIDCVDIKRLQIAADISTKNINFGSVKLLTSINSDDPRVIKIPKIKSVKEYSDFVIKRLDQYIDTEFALVIQHDGFILNPEAWTEDFLKYDYIGALWYYLGTPIVGNGGFSLRSKKLIHWLANNWKKIDASIHPEDFFICKFARVDIEKEGMVFAPENIAKRFSLEGNRRSVVWNGEFGFHGIKYTDISQWLSKHPEYKKDFIDKIDDYTTLMKKYPVYNGTVHAFDFRKCDMEDYIQLAKNQKKYEIRITKDKYLDHSIIKVGQTIIFKRWGVSITDVPVPAFEKKIVKTETFENYYKLKATYPKLQVTFPGHLTVWKIQLLKLFGDMFIPKDKSYTVFWFE